MRDWLNRFKAGVIAASGAVILLVAAYLRGRGAGREDERQERDASITRQADRARKEARDVQGQTARMDDAAIADELKRDWVRGAGPGRR
ncbi:hypothetical protein CEY09_14835 [Achromobacter marplatensis]|jgi:hypothetical protein|uniref:hypothetical protein n=1 Tax=Achromobacter marplatensis TaxID=470868 RepID=UPI0002781727|nr:hypothetical protein [Achromobacter marplatensis]EJO31661.1 hypothetical protein QWC_10526 [Achromobacter marplatensis]OWT67774.1 hypothetical protein CEY09_14835 [Achromobacter marplatensis]